MKFSYKFKLNKKGNHDIGLINKKNSLEVDNKYQRKS